MNHSEISSNTHTMTTNNNKNIFLEKTVTVVTAYYRIKSKHNPQTYDVWIRNLILNLGHSCKVVIFTSPDLIPYMKSVCNKNNKGATFTVISMPMKDFKIVKEYSSNVWFHQYSLDPQKACGRTIECYLIWNSKLWFIKEAMQRNIYGSDKYVWIDIGSLRNNDPDICASILNTFPAYERISSDKVDIMLIRPYLPHEKNQLIFFNTVHLGGMFGGGVDAIYQLYQLFYESLDFYLSKNYFAGCDQQILSTCYMRNPEIFNPVTKNNVNDQWDVWFYLYKYWNTTST
jgi:hypothetical protein